MSTLYEINIGFCQHIDFHNIFHNDCLTYDYFICDIVFLLPIFMVFEIGYLIKGVPSVLAAHNSHSIIIFGYVCF